MWRTLRQSCAILTMLAMLMTLAPAPVAAAFPGGGAAAGWPAFALAGPDPGLPQLPAAQPDPVPEPVPAADLAQRLAAPPPAPGPVAIARTWTGDPEEGPLGPGWRFAYDQILRMYAGYDITEWRSDGTRFTFRFHQNGPGFVHSYDGDSLIKYRLHQGFYTPDLDGAGTTLEREEPSMVYSFTPNSPMWSPYTLFPPSRMNG